MSAVMTTPSKGPKTQHRHAQSETPARSISNPNDSYPSPARSNQRRQGRNRNNHNHNQQHIAHCNPSASDTALVQGYMSAGNNEHGNRRKSNRYDGSVSDSPAAAMDNKNRRGGRRDRQPTPAQGGSPPKHNGMLAAGTPAKDSAYAGPAFHASPAASSLPMPKFFSKSVPPNNAPATMQTRLDQESDSSGTSEKSDSPPLVGATPVAQMLARQQSEQSPLDLFFKADREERARKASLLSTATPPGKSPAPVNAHNHMRHVSNSNKNGMFSMDMDGAAMTPKAASPSAHRMSAGRATSAPSDVPRAAQQEVESYPQALKDLFSSSQKPAAQSPLANGSVGTPTQNGQDFHTPSPFYRPSPGPRQLSGGPRTPAGQTTLEAYPPYYYGNRNLSPLFQAAKGDSAMRSSSLRQELGSSPSTHNRAELPVTHSASIPTTPSRPAAGKPDASAFSREFLNAHIQQTGPQDSLAAPYTNHPGLRSPFHHATSADVPRGQSPAADPKLVENDLKRLLKLQLVDT